MRVLVITSSFPPWTRGGGPARSTWNLVSAAAANHHVDVITVDRELGDKEPSDLLSGRKVKLASGFVYYANISSMRHAVSLLRQFRAQPHDLLILNSFWNVRLSLIPAIAFRLLWGGKLKVALLPRGELQPESLRYSKWKKQAALPLLRRLYSHVLDYVAATSDLELESIPRVLSGVVTLRTVNVAEEIPFGVPSAPSETMRIVYLGRINDDKGLLEVLSGLLEVKQAVTLTIAGAVQDEKYYSDCEHVMGQMPHNVSVNYVGEVGRGDLPRLLHEQDVFLTLTSAENFGHAIAEALQAGCPVIAPDTTPWTRTIRNGGGAIILDRNNRAEVAATIDQWASLTPNELLSRRGMARAAFDRSEVTRGSDVIELVAAIGHDPS